jgi:PAP2 superfamily
MLNSIFSAIRRKPWPVILATLGAVGVGASPLRADVITDWDAKISAVASPAALGEREATIVDLAMFDAVNSVFRRYRGFVTREDGFEHASAEAAAATAAATVIAKLHPEKAADVAAARDQYLKGLTGEPAALASGRQLGERVGGKVFDSRAGDGATGADPYRPLTQPGVYVPTATMVCSTWPKLKPFVLERPDQFRPGPPVSLASKEWAADYNEVKAFGARDSAQRTAPQTETARFWLMTGPQAYHPIAWQIIAARHLKLLDSARFMAMYSAALTDAYIAVFDAKYRYNFWRPITAIRNGDLDGNRDTESDATWQPIDATPMHPEYPCAHCILSAAASTVIESTGGLGDLREISLTSPMTPGVTHRWTNLADFSQEVANARVWAGFHYRSSTRVGASMGREVGGYVATHFDRSTRGT